MMGVPQFITLLLVPSVLAASLKRSTILDENDNAIFYAKRSADNTVLNEDEDAIFYVERAASDLLLDEDGGAIFYARSRRSSMRVCLAGDAIFYVKRSDIVENEEGEATFFLKDESDSVFTPRGETSCN